MVEKFAQERDIEFLDAERRWGSSQCRRGEAKQETKGIAVGRDRMGTGPELTEQSIGEEPLEERWQERRGSLSASCPSSTESVRRELQ